MLEQLDRIRGYATELLYRRLSLAGGEHLGALAPNSAFELSAFIQLSEDELQEYADGVCNAFSRHKAPQGTIYRYAPRRSAVIEAEELLNVLRREGDAPREEHHERQALLLSDIAGFD